MNEKIKNKKTFNMNFIIKNISNWEEEYREKSKRDGYKKYERKPIYERRRDYNRLHKIINFFQDYECEFLESNRNFLKNNLLPKKRETIGYDFSIESTVFYICLCENFKLKFFKNFINRKYSSKKEYDKWLCYMIMNLNNLETFYKENNPKYSWEDFRINIDSIISEFELINEKLINIEKEIFGVIVKFMSFSDWDKKDIYYEHMYSRFKYINNIIDEKIKKLESYKYDEKYDFVRNLYINNQKKVVIEKLSEKEKNLINEYIDKENRFKFFELQLSYYKKISQSKFKYNDKINFAENLVNMFKEFNLEPSSVE
ncbi:hypothetical protein ACSXCO_00410 [Clostridium perfringens]|uniref:hypothetical protein n=1 Tax=Clostridium perfringens TaxID=1502 RepID=UPI003F41D2E1